MSLTSFSVRSRRVLPTSHFSDESSNDNFYSTTSTPSRDDDVFSSKSPCPSKSQRPFVVPTLPVRNYDSPPSSPLSKLSTNNTTLVFPEYSSEELKTPTRETFVHPKNFGVGVNTDNKAPRKKSRVDSDFESPLSKKSIGRAQAISLVPSHYRNERTPQRTPHTTSHGRNPPHRKHAIVTSTPDIKQSSYHILSRSATPITTNQLWHVDSASESAESTLTDESPLKQRDVYSVGKREPLRMHMKKIDRQNVGCLNEDIADGSGRSSLLFGKVALPWRKRYSYDFLKSSNLLQNDSDKNALSASGSNLYSTPDLGNFTFTEPSIYSSNVSRRVFNSNGRHSQLLHSIYFR